MSKRRGTKSGPKPLEPLSRNITIEYSDTEENMGETLEQNANDKPNENEQSGQHGTGETSGSVGSPRSRTTRGENKQNADMAPPDGGGGGSSKKQNEAGNSIAPTDQESPLPAALQQIKDYMIWVLCVLVVIQAVTFYLMLSTNSAQQTEIDTLKDKLKVPHGRDSSGDLTQIKTDIDELNRKLETYPNEEFVNSKINDKTSDLVDNTKFRDEIETVNTNYKDLEFFKQKKDEIVEMLQKNSKLIKDMEKQEHNIKTLEDKAGQNSTSLMGNVSDLITRADDLKGELSVLQEMQTKLEKQAAIQEEQLKDSTTEIAKMVEKAKHELQSHLDKANKTLEVVKKETITIQDIQIKQERLLDLIKPNTFNKGAVTLAAVIIIAIVFALVISVYILCQRLSPEGTAANRPSGGRYQPANSVSKQPTHAVMERVPSDAKLEDGICVISYDNETQVFHRNLLLSCMTNMPEKVKADIQFHVVNRHEDVLTVSRKKLCFIFTEFSERHVIIEERRLGLGDLKRTVAESMVKMGCNLVIVYVRDPDSRRLRTDRLYNHDIDCVTSQELLSSLNAKRCFFSAYDKFTDFQKTSVSSLISEHVLR